MQGVGSLNFREAMQFNRSGGPIERWKPRAQERRRRGERGARKKKRREQMQSCKEINETP